MDQTFFLMVNGKKSLGFKIWSGNDPCYSHYTTRMGGGTLAGHFDIDSYVYRHYDEWATLFGKAPVHIQWDPERTLHGKSLPINSIQVGLSRHIIEKYVNEWTIEIQDITPLVRKIYGLLQGGQEAKARGFLPKERLYPLNSILAQRIGIR